MKLVYVNNRYELECSKHERQVPKEAGFRFDWDSCKWYTTDAHVAQRVAHYGDMDIRTILENQLKESAPTLRFSGTEYVWKSSIAFKDLPKKAGFRWNPESKVWYTREWDKAMKLSQYMDSDTKAHAEQEQVKYAASLSLSRAADSNVCLPAPEGLDYLPYQKAGIQYALERDAVLIGDEMGCIAGDALIKINRGGNCRTYTMKQLFERFEKSWDSSIDTFTSSLTASGQLRLNKVLKVLHKGVKPVIQITLASGKTLKLTADHEVAQSGDVWTEAGKLNVGDTVLTNGTPACKNCGAQDNLISYKYSKFLGFCKDCMYQTLRKNGNYKTGRTVDKEGYVRISGQKNHLRSNNNGWVYEHILVMEEHLNRSIVWPEQVHHINGDRSDNRIENLELLTVSEHHKVHQRHLNFQMFLPKEDTITKIEDAGNTDVYDIVMADPNRNFVVNGVIVHNCGKTIQAIGVLNASPSLRKVLILCPASLRLNWKRELEKWQVSNRSIEIVNTKKHTQGLPDADIVICNYDIAYKYKQYIDAIHWDVLIADEAHYLKNPKTKRTQAVFGSESGDNSPVKARKRIIMTGTPIPNRVKEIWPILRFLDAGTWNNFVQFGIRYCGAYRGSYGWNFDGASHLSELQDKLRSTVMVRRLKADVLSELPAKVRQIVHLEQNGASGLIAKEQKAFAQYEASMAQMRAEAELALLQSEQAYRTAVNKLTSYSKAAFSELSRLRHELALAKTDSVIEFVQNAIENENHKVILFAHHTDVIEQFKNAFGDKAVSLTGSTPMLERQKAVDRFQTDKSVQVFIGNIIAAGVGITLTAASHVVFAELDWVPGNVQQAEDRCILKGQPILTPEGWRKIEEIKIGDYVVTQDGTAQKVLDAWNKSCRKTITEIEVVGWKEPIKVTYDHPILNDKGEWIMASKYLPGDFIAMPNGNFCELTALDFDEDCRVENTFLNSFGASQKNGRLKKAPAQVTLNAETLFVFGYFAGDGFARAKENCGSFISFSGNNTTKVDSLNRVKEWLTSQNINYTVTERDNSVEVRGYSKEWANFFYKHFGKDAYSKKLPEFCMQLSPEQSSQLLKGLLSSDGYVRKNRNEYSTVSNVLCSHVCRVVMNAGMKPCVYEGSTKQFIVGWTENVRPFLKVKKVSSYYVSKEERVYDLTVDKNHSFVVGTSVVHNCHRIGQHNSVLVQHLVYDGSLDAKMAQTLVDKQAVMDAMLDDKSDYTRNTTQIEAPENEAVFLDQSLADKREQAYTRFPLKELDAYVFSEQEKTHIQTGLQIIASYCDGAKSMDGMGFNKVDSYIGKILAYQGQLSNREAALGKKLLTKYKRQLPNNF